MQQLFKKQKIKRVLKSFSQFRARTQLKTQPVDCNNACLLACLLFSSFFLLLGGSVPLFPTPLLYAYTVLLAPDKHTLIYEHYRLIASLVTLCLLSLASSVSLKCERDVFFWVISRWILTAVIGCLSRFLSTVGGWSIICDHREIIRSCPGCPHHRYPCFGCLVMEREQQDGAYIICGLIRLPVPAETPNCAHSHERSRAKRWGEIKAAVCIHVPLRCIAKQYIITPALSGHLCSHMIKSFIKILQRMFHFTAFDSILSAAMHIFSARRLRSWDSFIKHIVRHTDTSTHNTANPAEMPHEHT